MVLHHVVVDGSNLATEGRDTPSLAQLDEAVQAFIREYRPEIVTVVVDATFPNRIARSERRAYEDAVAAGEVVSPPAGAVGRGDAFVLQIADRSGGAVLSNDSFQEFHGTYPWLFEEGRLVGGKPVPHVGWVFMSRAPVRGPASRRAISAAKRAQAALSTSEPVAAPVKPSSGIPGADTAAPAKSTKATRSSKAGKAATPAKAAKTSKSARTAKSAKSATTAKDAQATRATESPKAGRAAKAGKATKDAQAARATEPPKAGRAAKAGKDVQPARGTESPKAGRAAKTAKDLQPARGAQPQKAARAAKPGKTAKDVQPARGAQPPKAPKSDRAAKAAKAGKPGEAAKAGRGGKPGKAPKAPEPARSAGGPARGVKAEPATSYNDALPFIEFVGTHPVGSRVEAVVEEFSSHGAYVQIDGVRAYAPLKYLGEPPPRSAKTVLRLGESREFVVVEIDAGRRGVDVALPDVGAAPAGHDGGSGVAKKGSANVASVLRRVLRR